MAAIDISSIVRKHLSTVGSIEESTAEESTVAVEESTVAVEESTPTEEKSTGIKLDFEQIVESTQHKTESVEETTHTWFMSESEQEHVSGALLASVIANNVEV